MKEQLLYKGVEVSIIKGEPNYVPPSIPFVSKKCICKEGMMELRPVNSTWLKNEDGFYIVNRINPYKMVLTNEVVSDYIYGCNKCAFCETVKLNRQNETIEVVE